MRFENPIEKRKNIVRSIYIYNIIIIYNNNIPDIPVLPFLLLFLIIILLLLSSKIIYFLIKKPKKPKKKPTAIAGSRLKFTKK